MGSNFNMKPITPVLSCSNSFNPTLHGLSQACSTLFWGGGGRGKGGGHKVPAAFFSETVKATTIKLGRQTN